MPTHPALQPKNHALPKLLHVAYRNWNARSTDLVNSPTPPKSRSCQKSQVRPRALKIPDSKLTISSQRKFPTPTRASQTYTNFRWLLCRQNLSTRAVKTFTTQTWAMKTTKKSYQTSTSTSPTTTIPTRSLCCKNCSWLTTKRSKRRSKKVYAKIRPKKIFSGQNWAKFAANSNFLLHKNFLLG